MNGLSSYFVWLNRGKQSLVADIKQPADAALLHRILARADVFIQNLAPGAAARAGFGSDALRARHERLITVDISGYGEGHAYADMKAYDLLVQAESGLASITGHPAGPGRVGVSACDIACGMAAHAGVLEALIERGRTGRGKGLKVSLFDGMADWMNVPLLYYEGTGRVPARIGLAHPSICPTARSTRPMAPLVLISIQNEREWAASARISCGSRTLPRQPGFETQHDAGRQPPGGGRACRRRVRRADPGRGGGTAAAGGHRLRLRQRCGRAVAPPGAAAGSVQTPCRPGRDRGAPPADLGRAEAVRGRSKRRSPYRGGAEGFRAGLAEWRSDVCGRPTTA